MKNHQRRVGTVSRGIRCPIIREGDNLAAIVTESVLAAASEENFEIRDRDVISVTESVVARSQGNYAPVSAIAKDVKEKTGGGTARCLPFDEKPFGDTCPLNGEKADSVIYFAKAY